MLFLGDGLLDGAFLWSFFWIIEEKRVSIWWKMESCQFLKISSKVVHCVSDTINLTWLFLNVLVKWWKFRPNLIRKRGVKWTEFPRQNECKKSEKTVYKFECVSEFSHFIRSLHKQEKSPLTHRNEQNTNQTSLFRCGRVSYTSCIIFIWFFIYGKIPKTP